jgi:uncharacterized BrkB/YihY/UPF0761 family membrane protein
MLRVRAPARQIIARATFGGTVHCTHARRPRHRLITHAVDDKPIQSLKAGLTARYEHLEATRRLGVPLAATRRFFEIEGLDLGGLLALELFTTVIPIILIGFGWASHFTTEFSFGDLLIRQLGLTGAKAEQVRGAFGSSASLKSTWTVVGLASFLVWGIPMASQVAKTFARAWRRERFGFASEVWRGAVWFALFLGAQVATVAISKGHVHSAGDVARNIAGLAPSFVLWSATPPVLVRNGATGWRHLAWCGLAGVVLDAVLIRMATRILLPALLGGWAGFGPIGVAMTLMTWCSVVAALWVITACLSAVLWERNAPADTVIAAQLAVAELPGGNS